MKKLIFKTLSVILVYQNYAISMHEEPQAQASIVAHPTEAQNLPVATRVVYDGQQPTVTVTAKQFDPSIQTAELITDDPYYHNDFHESMLNQPHLIDLDATLDEEFHTSFGKVPSNYLDLIHDQNIVDEAYHAILQDDVFHDALPPKPIESGTKPKFININPTLDTLRTTNMYQTQQELETLSGHLGSLLSTANIIRAKNPDLDDNGVNAVLTQYLMKQNYDQDAEKNSEIKAVFHQTLTNHCIYY